MGWGARTHEGQFHTRPKRRSQTPRTVRLHTDFKPGQRGVIDGRVYEVTTAGSLRRLLDVVRRVTGHRQSGAAA